jgi:integrase
MVAYSAPVMYYNVMSSGLVAGRIEWARPAGRLVGIRERRALPDVFVPPAQPVAAPRRGRGPDRFPALPLRPLLAEYTATFGSTWRPVTKRKHADDYARFLGWLDENGIPATTDALDFATLVAYVEDLRTRPKVCGVWRGAPGALGRALAAGSTQTLSANSINAYMRPIRSLAIWLVDEGLLALNPFRRSRRRAALNPLLPSEETPTKGGTLEDLRALERGCAGDEPLDLRDRAIVAILVTTAARNSSVRLLRVEDIDVARSVIRFRRAKGGRTLEVALHADARTALLDYLSRGRPELVNSSDDSDSGVLFPSRKGEGIQPPGMNAVSLMLTRRYHAGGGTLPYFGSHRIRHATATLLSTTGCRSRR